MPGWSVLWLLTLIWVNSWYTVECGLPKAFNESTKTGIILSREATRNYFLDILEGATKKNISLPPDVRTPLAMVKSDITGYVRVNFRSHYVKRNRRKHPAQLTYRSAFKGTKAVGFAKIGYAGGLERLTPNGIPLVWQLYSWVREEDVMTDNAGIKHVVEKRAEKGEGERQYRTRLSLFLNTRDPTHAFFCWDPVDGFIGLAFNEFQDTATMYQAHWNTIALFAKKAKVCKNSYDIPDKCFRKEVNKGMDYFINKFRAWPHLLVNPSFADRTRNPAKRKRQCSAACIPAHH